MHSTAAAAYWVLRVGAALCFIGHGAFGFITKPAWLPYFGVVGIPEAWAWRLMPIVGAVDVLAGMAVLFAPRGLPLVYMTVWATWTALLRPLVGRERLRDAGARGELRRAVRPAAADRRCRVHGAASPSSLDRPADDERHTAHRSTDPEVDDVPAAARPRCPRGNDGQGNAHRAVRRDRAARPRRRPWWVGSRSRSR